MATAPIIAQDLSCAQLTLKENYFNSSLGEESEIRYIPRLRSPAPNAKTRAFAVISNITKAACVVLSAGGSGLKATGTVLKLGGTISAATGLVVGTILNVSGDAFTGAGSLVQTASNGLSNYATSPTATPL